VALSNIHKIFIFYSMISEEKNKSLKLLGPYIHKKPDEIANGDPYIFEVSIFKSEQQYLSNMLREKYPYKYPIYHSINIDKFDKFIRCTCGKPIPINKESYICDCGEIILKVLDKINYKIREKAFTEAQDYFDKKFEQMKNNFTICMRR